MLVITYLVASIILILLAYIIFKVIVHRDYQRNGRLGWFSTFLEFLIFVLHANFCYIYLPTRWWGIPKLLDNRFINITGFSLFIAGLILVFISMTGLGYIKACGRKVNGLKQSGLYSLTRNPQIVSYALVVIGVAVLWPSWYSLGWVLLYGVIAHMMVTTEEKHLEKAYGESYINYCKRVPRYLFF